MASRKRLSTSSSRTDHSSNPRSILIAPIYDSSPCGLACDERRMRSLPTILGRRNLAELWWFACPNCCGAENPQNKPCQAFCYPIRRKSHRELLSRDIVAIDGEGNVQIVAKNDHLIHWACLDGDSVPSQWKLQTTSRYRLEIGDGMGSIWMKFEITAAHAVTPDHWFQATATPTRKRPQSSGLFAASDWSTSRQRRQLFSRINKSSSTSDDDDLSLCTGNQSCTKSWNDHVLPTELMDSQLPGRHDDWFSRAKRSLFTPRHTRNSEMITQNRVVNKNLYDQEILYDCNLQTAVEGKNDSEHCSVRASAIPVLSQWYDASRPKDLPKNYGTDIIIKDYDEAHSIYCESSRRGTPTEAVCNLGQQTDALTTFEWNDPNSRTNGPLRTDDACSKLAHFQLRAESDTDVQHDNSSIGAFDLGISQHQNDDRCSDFSVTLFQDTQEPRVVICDANCGTAGNTCTGGPVGLITPHVDGGGLLNSSALYTPTYLPTCNNDGSSDESQSYVQDSLTSQVIKSRSTFLIQRPGETQRNRCIHWSLQDWARLRKVNVTSSFTKSIIDIITKRNSADAIENRPVSLPKILDSETFALFEP